MFRKLLLGMILGLAVLAPEAFAPFSKVPLVSTAEARYCLYYAKVYYNGRAGYLGGYVSRAAADHYARLWVRGVGRGASYRGETFVDCR